MSKSIADSIISAIAEHLEKHGEIKTMLKGKEYIIRGQYGIDWLSLNDIKLSDDCIEFFENEIENEQFGGVSPSTLASALDSLKQGDEVVFDNINYDAVLAEVEELISRLGENINISYLSSPYAFDKDGNSIWVGAKEAASRFNIILPIDEQIHVRKIDLIYEKLNQIKRVRNNRRKTNAVIVDKLGKG